MLVRNTITSTAPELALSISYGIHLALEGLEYRHSHRLLPGRLSVSNTKVPLSDPTTAYIYRNHVVSSVEPATRL